MKTAKEKPTTDFCIGSLFLDSGAHSLYNIHVLKKKKSLARVGEGEYDFYNTKEFWAYVDDYAKFLKKYGSCLDYYANVDVIYNPEKSWEVQRYLEDKHGLHPVPVVHYATSLKWVEKYLDYPLLGVGGLGQGVGMTEYVSWADRLFDLLCPSPSRLPVIKTHGFAMTAYDLMIRYPWFSVDSASWVKAGGFGMINVPHKRGGAFTFSVAPYSIAISSDSPSVTVKGRNYATLDKNERAVVEEWLEQIDIPLGSVDEDGEMVDWGVVSHHAARKIANLKFYQALVDWLPKWPWPFRVKAEKGLF